MWMNIFVTKKYVVECEYVYMLTGAPNENIVQTT